MLRLENVCFFKDNKDILKDINLEVEEGKFIAITGPNGSGKSTLAKIIMGIEKPTSGKIFFDGEDITELSIDQRANKGMGFAFQQPVKFKGITVYDLLKLAAKKDVSRAEACEYLSAVGLCAKEYIDREVNASLSGGELKRIEIATVALRKTKLTIFDEPEAASFISADLTRPLLTNSPPRGVLLAWFSNNAILFPPLFSYAFTTYTK